MKLEDLSWSGRLETLYDSFANDDSIPGRVLRVDRGAVTDETDIAAFVTAVAGKLNPEGEPGPPAVGDWVVLEMRADTVVVRAILPRSGALTRRRPGEAERAQAVAANVDLVLVVESVERGPNPRRIERATALAWEGGATPLVVLTKADLVDDVVDAIERAGKVRHSSTSWHSRPSETTVSASSSPSSSGGSRR